MDAVTVAGATAHITALTELSYELNAGELWVVVPERHVDTVSLYDVASGLIAPDRGTVSFDGEDWQRMGLFDQSAVRGRISRIFEIEGWVSNLNIFENIALSQRHHTTRSDDELREAIGRLCERIGLRDCLDERPHALARGERRRAQWVRALLGQPDLLLLNAPLLEVRVDDQAVLFELLAEARERGTAVMWKSRDQASWKGQPGFEDAEIRLLVNGRLERDARDGA
jgi:phospholipid/cholesterol/gamma-HCH transport system ATP-binding protein